MTNKTLLDTLEYCMKLYRNSLKEIREASLDFRLNFPKWKKDTLLLILEKAKPDIKRKHLRRKVLIDLKRISDEARKEIDEREEEEMEKWMRRVEQRGMKGA
jgi:hypothetical protein